MRKLHLTGLLLLGAGEACIAMQAPLVQTPHLQSALTEQRQDACRDILPLRSANVQAVDAQTLARIRDIGSNRDTGTGQQTLALSPDGRQLAIVLQRADPVRNAYCNALIVLPLQSAAAPFIVDTGGDLITIRDNYLGMADFPTGARDSVEPKWAQDGRSIAFLKRENGVTQLWQAFTDGRAARQLTRSATDVEQPGWSDDGRTLFYRTRPGMIAARAAIKDEGRQGYLYDARFPALGSAKPLPPSSVPYAWMALRLENGAVRTASDAERQSVTGRMQRVFDTAEMAVVKARQDDRLAWAEAVQPDALLPFFRVRVRIADRNFSCTGDTCVGDIRGMWWLSDGQLVFLRSDGVGNGEQAFYRWKPGKTAPQQILKGDALWASCQPHDLMLICLRETPTRPREVVVLDVDRGSTKVVFDPNPEITGAPHGSIKRLTWRDERGGSAFGYLVLPRDHKPGQKLPLVVVQYWAKGFQRGGVGDEVPIFPLANAGFAVLNFDRPRDRATLIRNRSDAEYMREAMHDWKDRRDVLASLEAGVRLLIDRGIVDPKRVGLTGLSDGGETTQFALIHSTMFAAASLGTCCKDPLAFTALAGPAQWAAQEQWGLQPYTEASREQWQAASLALNADRITTPILLQLSDWEFRMAIQTVAEFQRRGRPLELRVFPDEAHIKTQPAHRLALYNRNIQWFSKWLNPALKP